MPKQRINPPLALRRARKDIEADHVRLCAELGNATFTYLATQERLYKEFSRLSLEYELSPQVEVKEAT